MKLISFIATFLFAITGIYAQKDNSQGWPREVEKKGFTVVFYQPQPETFTDDNLEGRMAISLKRPDSEPIFGAAWFQTRIETDLDSRQVYFRDMVFTSMKFPDVKEENQKALSDMLTGEIGRMNIDMSLDRFLVSLDGIKSQQEDLAESLFDNTPPAVYFRNRPAVLVLIDGEPIMKPTDQSNLVKVLNTPYFLVLDTSKDKYYLNGGSWWYESDYLETGWVVIKKVPSNVRKYNESLKSKETTSMDSEDSKIKDPPDIILSTKPAELITSNGSPEFSAIEGTNLLYLSNSENDVIKDNSSGQFYTLISGRWFRSGSLEMSSWAYVNPNNLPEDFRNIPSDSPVATVRTSIPGTQESREAILENSIPQTAEIDRRTATTVVKYDGEPKFERVKKTDISYAVNTDKSVLLYDRGYYCVDEGVWFSAPSPKGPWRVCDNVPEAIYDIPPSSPVYNVTYVRVYDATPEYVYVGYTPGYYGSYVSYGTVIYGTGYYYSPWYGGYYYPRPVTYGYGVHYNPYTGWGYSVGLSYGWIYYNSYPYYWGYWGPAGYRYGYRYGYGQGYYHGYYDAYYPNRRVGSTRTYRGQTNTYGSSSNVYRNRTTGVRSTGGTYRSGNTGNTGNTRSTGGNYRSGSTDVNRSATPVPRRSSQPNNVYSDPNGNIYRRQDNGSWQQRNNSTGQWQNRTGTTTTTPSQGSRSGATNTGVPSRTATPQPSLNRDYDTRNRGTTRTSNYNQIQQRSGTATPQRQAVPTTPKKPVKRNK